MTQPTPTPEPGTPLDSVVQAQNAQREEMERQAEAEPTVGEETKP